MEIIPKRSVSKKHISGVSFHTYCNRVLRVKCSQWKKIKPCVMRNKIYNTPDEKTNTVRKDQREENRNRTKEYVQK